MNVYIYQAALLCEECGLQRQQVLIDIGHPGSMDSDEYPQGPYPDGGGEADSPQHCDHCGVFLENPLTSDGEAYVRSMCPPQPDGVGTITGQWREFYAYLFRE